MTPASHWRGALPVALVMLAAAIPRLWGLGNAPLWFDEAMYAWYVRAPLDMEWFSGRGMLAEPLFVTALHYWGRWGESEWWLRLPSAFAGMGVVACAMGIGHSLSGRRGLLLSGILAAVSPLLIFYSRDAKMYSWVALFFLLAVWSGLAYTRGGGWRPLAAYGLAAIALCYTHLLAPLYLAATALCFLWPLRHTTRRALTWVSLNAMVVLAAMPIILAQWRHTQTMQGRGFHAPLPELPDLWITIAVFAGGYGPRTALAAAAAAAMLFGLLVLGIRLFRNPAAMAALLCALLPVLSLFAISRLAPWSLYVDRYLIGAAALLIALAGAGVAQMRRGPQLAALLALICIPLALDAMALRLHPDARRHKGVVPRMDARRMAQDFTAQSRPHDTVLHVSWETLPVLRWYLPHQEHVLAQREDEVRTMLDHLVSAEFLEFYAMTPVRYEPLLESRQRLWVVAPWADQAMRPLTEGLLSEMDRRGARLWGSEYGGLAGLYLYELNGAASGHRNKTHVQLAHSELVVHLDKTATDAVRLRAVNEGDEPVTLQYQSLCAAFEVAASAVPPGEGWTLMPYLAPGGMRHAAVATTGSGHPPEDMRIGAITMSGEFDLYIERTLTGRQHGVPGASLIIDCNGVSFEVPASASDYPAGGWHWMKAGALALEGGTHTLRLRVAAQDSGEAFAAWSRICLVPAGSSMAPPTMDNGVLQVADQSEAEAIVPCHAGIVSVMGAAGDRVFYVSSGP